MPESTSGEWSAGLHAVTLVFVCCSISYIWFSGFLGNIWKGIQLYLDDIALQTATPYNSECPICADPCEHPIMIDCKHQYCKRCLVDMWDHSKSINRSAMVKCCICRQQIKNLVSGPCTNTVQHPSQCMDCGLRHQSVEQYKECIIHANYTAARLARNKTMIF
ncbi:hypothetical protein GCK72_023118 [Caenorhabditis remanei]|nr:hypothetical protein GCK72_023118 [Caenorhabditis remanei]KAF1746661.1 hypothetical protein GCK72_023118 [Caenorhabditis remanei]